MNRPPILRILELCVAVFVVAILASQALQLTPGLRPYVRATVSWSADATGTVYATESVEANFASTFSSAAYHEAATARSDVIYYYFDPQYPLSYSDIPDWFGLSQHLAAIAQARGLPMEVRVMDTAQLLRVFADPTTTNATVIFASGVLPSPIFSASEDHLGPWMRAGGLVIWVGDQIGAYTGIANQGVGCGSNDTLGQAGTARLMNVSWLANNASSCNQIPSPNLMLYLDQTPDGRALGVQYPYGIPGPSLVISRVEAGGGLSLGNEWNSTTNIAYIPSGRGGLLDISAPATDPVRLSTSIDNLWQSGILERGSHLDDYQFASLPSPGKYTTSFVFPSGVGARTDRHCVFISQVDYLASFAHLSCWTPGVPA